ncbi:hypothetical protein KXV60_008637 [Aspergillus fumigatus]|nr:hypothetical protein KXW78_004410 [Aspergillus fumigatus]KAH3436570.1 hypothetical protein KXV60_008637 [Aspergillus fumigatus]
MPSLHQFRHHLHDARKQIEELEQQVALYEELLQHLRFRVDTQDAELIARTLHRRSSNHRASIPGSSQRDTSDPDSAVGGRGLCGGLPSESATPTHSAI